MELRNLAAGDLALYEAIHCDPAMMEHLGGPFPREGLAEKLAVDIAATEADECWVLVIVPDDEPEAAAGTVTVWDHAFEDGTNLTEIGWMVLPAYQGRGLGKRAVRKVIERARSNGRWNILYAFPPVANERSNAMCRTLGFTFLGAEDFAFHDQVLRCNRWALDLGARP